MSRCHRIAALLHSYHDEELGHWNRWRLERHLGRCSRCQSDLGRIKQVREWVRAASPVDGSPQLWERIAERLPALDRQLEAEARAARAGSSRLARLAAPLGAGMAVAAVGLAAFSLLWAEPRPSGAVRSMYSPTQSIILLEDSEDSTIIWVVDTPGEQSSGEVRHALG